MHPVRNDVPAANRRPGDARGIRQRSWAEDYPFGRNPEAYEGFLQSIQDGWGGAVGLEVRAPSMLDDERFRTWWATYLRMSATPGAAYALTLMNGGIDVRHALPTVRVPTLIVHRTGDQSLPVEGSRYMADRIRGAKLVELPGDDHLPWVGDQDEILDEVEEFLTGVRRGQTPIACSRPCSSQTLVRSTERAAELGDKRWRELLASHHAAVRRQLAEWRGTEIDATGDGFLATFDRSSTSDSLCVCRPRRCTRPRARDPAGLHTGEYQIFGSTIAGLTVHTCARVAAARRFGRGSRCRAPSRISSPARGSSSTIAGSTS